MTSLAGSEAHYASGGAAAGALAGGVAAGDSSVAAEEEREAALKLQCPGCRTAARRRGL